MTKVVSLSGPNDSLVEAVSQEGQTIQEHFTKIVAFLEGTEDIDNYEEMVDWFITLEKSEMTLVLNALRNHSRYRAAAIASASAVDVAQGMCAIAEGMRAKVDEQRDLSVAAYHRMTIDTAGFMSATMRFGNSQAIPSHARRVQGKNAVASDISS